MLKQCRSHTQASRLSGVQSHTIEIVPRPILYHESNLKYDQTCTSIEFVPRSKVYHGQTCTTIKVVPRIELVPQSNMCHVRTCTKIQLVPGFNLYQDSTYITTDVVQRMELVTKSNLYHNRTCLKQCGGAGFVGLYHEFNQDCDSLLVLDLDIQLDCDSLLRSRCAGQEWSCAFAQSGEILQTIRGTGL